MSVTVGGTETESGLDELAPLIESYLQTSLACGHSRGTLVYRRVYLRQFVAWLRQREVPDLASVSYRLLDDYVQYLFARRSSYNRRTPAQLSPRTIAAAVSVLRSFFTWAVRSQVLPANLAQDLTAGPTAPAPRRAVLTVEQADALMSAPEPAGIGLRDRAILETLYSTGLRRSELCGLDCYDLDAVRGVVLVRYGKGGRDRVVPIGRRAIEAVRAYAREIRKCLAADRREPALFLGTVTGERLKPATLNLIVQQQAARAGIPWPVTPMTLRHTCATHLLQGGADVRDVQAILGHVCLETTQLYTRVELDDVVAAHRRHHPRERLRMP